MSYARVMKQAWYGLGFFVALAVVATLVGVAVVRPAPPGPTPSPTPARQPVQVEQVSIVSHDTTVDLVARLRNPNARDGLPQYTVTFILLDQGGQEISRYDKATFILPGALQYVALFNIPVNQRIGQVRLQVPAEPMFSTVPAVVSLPTFNTVLRERTSRLIGGQSVEEQKGVVTNTGTLDWGRVEVIGIAMDGSDQVVGVGQTFVGTLAVGEQREFTLQWPSPTSPTARVIVLPTTNIYLEENVIKIIGDPGTLR